MKNKIRIEKVLDEGRVFVSAHNMQVEIHVTDRGIDVEIVSGNTVLASASAEKE